MSTSTTHNFPPLQRRRPRQSSLSTTPSRKISGRGRMKHKTYNRHVSLQLRHLSFPFFFPPNLGTLSDSEADMGLRRPASHRRAARLLWPNLGRLLPGRRTCFSQINCMFFRRVERKEAGCSKRKRNERLRENPKKVENKNQPK